MVDLGHEVIQASSHLLVLFFGSEILALPDLILDFLEDRDCYGLVVFRGLPQVVSLTLVRAVHPHLDHLLIFYLHIHCFLHLANLCGFSHVLEGPFESECLNYIFVLHSSLWCFLQSPERLLDDEVRVPEEAELACNTKVLLFRPYLLEIRPEASHRSLPTFLMQIVIHFADIVQLLHFHVPEFLKCFEVGA